jgi:2-(1,2-epoxy-1,2-dihydrophenyl)acetyl-CoA isomerase
MREGFEAAVDRVRRDGDICAVILTGAGGVFCAGGDIRSMQQAGDDMPIEAGRDRMAGLHHWVRQLIELPKPLITAVDGAAYGAGFSFTLMGDFVLATPKARFCMSFMRVGLIPDCAAMYLLPRWVGVSRAKEIMMSAREVSVDEAQRLGIVMDIVPVEDLMARARALAASFTGASPLGVSLIKKEVGMSLATDLPTTLNNEADRQAMCFKTGYHKQAVANFLEKKPAMFHFPGK